MKLNKSYWVIVETVEGRIFTNPNKVSPSVRIDTYLTFPDLIDFKKCTFSKRNTAQRKLDKLKKIFMDQHKSNNSYRQHCMIEGSSMDEYVSYLDDLFMRHWQVREIYLDVCIDNFRSDII